MIVERRYLAAGSGHQPALPIGLDSAQTLVLAFSGLPAEALRAYLPALRAGFPRSVLLGCSTSGEVFGPTVRDGGLAVAVTRFEHAILSSAWVQVGDSGGAFASGVKLAAAVRIPGLKAVLVLSDGLDVNGSELVRGLRAELDENVVITGGLAGDADRFTRTWVLAGGQARSGIVAAVGFAGAGLAVGHGSRGGWDIFGPQRLVTRAEGNVVYELDGRNALDLYEEYLGEFAAGLPMSGLFFPLSIAGEDGEEDIVRTLLAVDRTARSLTFAGDVPVGCRAQLMHANLDQIVAGAAEAATLATAADPVTAAAAGPVLGVAISCAGRRLVLKDRVEEELEAVLDQLPSGTELVGFYSYGEISPLASGRCELLNQTMTLTTFAESL